MNAPPIPVRPSEVTEFAVAQVDVGDAIQLIEYQGHSRFWLIGEVPGEIEPARLGIRDNGRPAAVVIAVIDHELRLSPDLTVDQFAQPMTQQVGIRYALPNPSTRSVDPPSEADVDRFLDL